MQKVYVTGYVSPADGDEKESVRAFAAFLTLDEAKKSATHKANQDQSTNQWFIAESTLAVTSNMPPANFTPIP